FNGSQLSRDAHLHVTLAPLRGSFRMKTDESQRRADFAGGKILLVRAVLEKPPQKVGSSGRGGSRRVWPTDKSTRQRPKNCGSRKIIEFEVFFRSSFPIVDVRLIPDLPKPCLCLGFAVAVPEMSGKVKHDIRPFLIILRRISPAGENCALRKVVSIRLRVH